MQSKPGQPDNPINGPILIPHPARNHQYVRKNIIGFEIFFMLFCSSSKEFVFLFFIRFCFVRFIIILLLFIYISYFCSRDMVQ